MSSLEIVSLGKLLWTSSLISITYSRKAPAVGA